MKIRMISLIALLATPLAGFANPIGLQTDSFQNGTLSGWFAGGLGTGQVPPVPPTIVPTGGPGGAGDQYMRITAYGGQGPGSRLVAINGAQWAGDYTGIPLIGMDLINLGPSDLQIRLLFEDPSGGPPVDQAISTVPFLLVSGSGWQHALFPIAPGDLTALSGSPALALSQATLLRIVHASTPAGADPIAGTLGVDNISSTVTAVPEPATMTMLGAGLLLLSRVRARK
jgi:hypothetical protein